MLERHRNWESSKNISELDIMRMGEVRNTEVRDAMERMERRLPADMNDASKRLAEL